MFRADLAGCNGQIVGYVFVVSVQPAKLGGGQIASPANWEEHPFSS